MIFVVTKQTNSRSVAKKKPPMNDADGFPTVSAEKLAAATTTEPRVAVLHQRQ